MPDDSVKVPKTVVTSQNGAELTRPILTAEQLAARWQVPTSWVYAKTRSGSIPRLPLPGRYYRYRLDVIEAFERSQVDSTDRKAD